MLTHKVIWFSQQVWQKKIVSLEVTLLSCSDHKRIHLINSKQNEKDLMLNKLQGVIIFGITPEQLQMTRGCGHSASALRRHKHKGR